MRTFLCAMICVAGLAVPPAVDAAAVGGTPRPPRIVLAVDGLGQTRNLPVLLAERLHYFTDAGLTVTLVDAPADPSPDLMIADGRADGAVAFYHHTFMTQVDRDLVSEAVIVMGATPQLKLIVARRLAGAIRSVTRAGWVGSVSCGSLLWMDSAAIIRITASTTRPPIMMANWRMVVWSDLLREPLTRVLQSVDNPGRAR